MVEFIFSFAPLFSFRKFAPSVCTIQYAQSPCGDPARLQAHESVWAIYCPERRGEVRCGCRRASPSCAADCPEKRRGLLLLLLVMGRWSDVPHLPEGSVALLCCRCRAGYVRRWAKWSGAMCRWRPATDLWVPG